MATAALRQGIWIDQYKIDDPGDASGFDNNLFFISHKVQEVVRQVSSVNYHTFKEDMLCWENVDEPTCPCDSDGQGGQLSEGMCFLDSIMAAGGVTIGADLTDAAEKSIYLAFIWEWTLHKTFQDGVAEMIAEGLNATQQRRGLKFGMFMNGIDVVTSQALANDWITNGVQPTYNDLNLATVPQQYRRPLKLFGEVGWFE